MMGGEDGLCSCGLSTTDPYKVFVSLMWVCGACLSC
jgi:hypothetical protein